MTLYAVLTMSFLHKETIVEFQNETKEVKEFATETEARDYMKAEGFKKGSCTPNINSTSDTLYWKVIE